LSVGRLLKLPTSTTQWRSRDFSRKRFNMPQRPDAMTITDGVGAVLYAGALEADVPKEERTRL
jgi:hypothetical protein